MTERHAPIRTALEAVPHSKWSASGPTVTIPETEDWPGKSISITGLDKKVARRLARYLATMNPAAIAPLLADADRASQLEAENARLREVLSKYANPDNWEEDEYAWARLWVEPDSTSPRSYNGNELANAALAQEAEQ